MSEALQLSEDQIQLLYVTEKGNLDLVKFFIEKDINNIEIVNKDGLHLLDIAYKYKHLEVVEYIIEKQEEKQNRLFEAIECNNPEIVQHLTMGQQNIDNSENKRELFQTAFDNDSFDVINYFITSEIEKEYKKEQQKQKSIQKATDEFTKIENQKQLNG